MRIRSELRLGIGLLIGVQVTATVLAVRQLELLSPAVERVINDNISTLEAGEEILAALTRAESRTRAERPMLVVRALETARAHLTLDGEAELVDIIDAHLDGALDGSPQDRARVVQAVRDLGDLNRRGVAEVDRDVQSRSIASAWVVLLFGVTAAALTLLLQRRWGDRFMLPILEMRDALADVESGNRFRRVTPLDGPDEAKELTAALNRLVDRAQRAEDNAPTSRR